MLHHNEKRKRKNLSCVKLSSPQTTPNSRRSSVMSTITQDLLFRLSLIRYAEKHGVTKAAVKYHINRQYIYRWKKRFDGSLDSLRYLSRKPHSHPNQHTQEELKLIFDMRRRNPHAGLIVFWVKLMQRGATSVLSQGSIASSESRESWLRSLPTRSISPSTMNKCSIRDRGFRLM